MTPVTPYGALLDFICVEMGFCGSETGGKRLRVSDLIPGVGMVTADQFAGMVFQAEGMEPVPEHQQALQAAFVKFMGASAVDARRLR
ncbi:hypothetical protein [Maricaulis sp.]|uniref:hypothetical protein n=1 Tax=Maricaulis sp. TaxID=1486257 RepID=UPI003A94B322